MTDAISQGRPPWSRAKSAALIVFGSCLFGWTLTSMDQSLFGYAIPGIRREFGASLEDIGWLLTASFVLASIVSVLVGVLADMMGRRLMFVIGLSCSAIFVGLHALAGGLVMLAVLRALAFSLSNTLSPITNAYVAEAAPARYRGLLVGLLQTGYPIGWFVASLFVAPLLASYGWRATFLPAFAVAVLAFVIAKFLPESERFKRQQTESAGSQDAKQGFDQFCGKLAMLFQPSMRRQTLLCFAVFFLFGGAYAGTAFYFPAYFQEFRGYSEVEATSIVGMSYGVGLLGYVAVAIIGEFILTRRNTAIIWALIGAFATAGLLWLPDSYAQDIIWFSLMASFFYGTSAALAMLLVELFPTPVRASGIALSGSAALLLGHAVFPILVAQAIAALGWQVAFSLAVIPPMIVVGILLFGLKNYASGLELDAIKV